MPCVKCQEERSRRGRFVAVAVLLICAGGCGAKEGTVVGSVQYQGKPVAGGVVELYDKSTGVGASAKIAGGSFTFATPIRPGAYAVTIIPPQPAAPEDPMPVCNDIPAKYQDAKKSGLTISVAPGQNSLPIELQ